MGVSLQDSRPVREGDGSCKVAGSVDEVGILVVGSLVDTRKQLGEVVPARLCLTGERVHIRDGMPLGLASP